MAEVETTTQDTLFGGAVALVQPARGGAYRVNVDAILLASFAGGLLGGTPPIRRARHAFDLGAGVGAIGLSLLHLDVAEHVTMIEVDAALAKLAQRNARANGWESRIDVVHADVGDTERVPAGVADLVVCNPPYITPGRGRAPSPARARARSGHLGVFLDAARRVAGRRARVCFVYPAIEATTLLTELRQRGLEPKRLRAVHGAPRKNVDRARVVLVEAVAGKPGGLVIEPPYFEVPSRARGLKPEA